MLCHKKKQNNYDFKALNFNFLTETTKSHNYEFENHNYEIKSHNTNEMENKKTHAGFTLAKWRS